MSRSIRIVVTPFDGRPTLHEFRNFGEDVYRAVRELCEVDLTEIDRSTDSFLLRSIPPKNKGQVVQAIKKLARRYGIESIAIRDEK